MCLSNAANSCDVRYGWAESDKAKAVAEGAEGLLRREKDSLAAQLASRQHQLDLLTQDKAGRALVCASCEPR